MPWNAIASIGSSLIGGLLNRPKTTTQQQRPYYTPEQQQINSLVSSRLQARLADPSAGTEPIKTGALTDINRRYADAGDTLASRMAAKGYGTAGADGRAGRMNLNLELSRFRDQGDLETKMAQYIMQRDDNTLGLAQRFGQASGSTTTGTQSGNVLGGAASGGMSTLSTMLMLDKLLKGGKTGSGGGTDLSYSDDPFFGSAWSGGDGDYGGDGQQ
jgi:hypothetical protein